jgi:hypothetical protein
VGPALRLSCRSELHVLPQFPVAQTIRSPNHDELSRPHRFLKSGPACYGFVCHPGISPLSRYGIQLALVLPSVLPVMSLQTSCGLHRFEPVIGTVSPPPWAMLLTRQGISLRSVNFTCAKRWVCSFQTHPACRHAARTISSLTTCKSRQCLACSL